jgi:hypothetical protein
MHCYNISGNSRYIGKRKNEYLERTEKFEIRNPEPFLKPKRGISKTPWNSELLLRGLYP